MPRSQCGACLLSCILSSLCVIDGAGLTRAMAMRRGGVLLPSISALRVASPLDILLPITALLFKVSPIIARSRDSPDTQPVLRSALVENNEAHLDFF